MRINLYARPYLGAVALCASSLLGLVGLFVLEGPGYFASFVLAALPLALGLLARWRASRRPPRRQA